MNAQNEQQFSNSIAPALGEFISGFEEWLSGQPLQNHGKDVDFELLEALTSTLWCWVLELRELGNAGILKTMGPEEAAQVHGLLGGAIDQLAELYRVGGASPKIMMMALSPVDDILVFLKLRASEARSALVF